MNTATAARTASLGMRLFVAADAATFAGLLAAAWILRDGGWRAPGQGPPALAIGIALTAILLASSAALIGARRRPRLGYGAAAALGAVFVALAAVEWGELAAAGLVLGDSRLADVFYLLTGYHLAHVAAGVLTLAAFAARSPGPGGQVAIAWYWHFVDAVWLAIAATLYLA
jgi:cytochrome c oxidase subunit 3